tara:strand:+ start:842 stop:1366 length:525 start_codon:yes stop_codon:yes gene_type:complete
MATISIPGDSSAITQVGGYGQKAGLLAPHMEKCTVDTDKVYRVVSTYSCDTWEIFIALGSNTPMVRVFGLDNDYSGSGAPAAGTKFELNIKDNYSAGAIVLDGGGAYESGGGYDMASLSVQSIIVDQAWKGLMFEVEKKLAADVAGTATIKVKAYRSGQCTFEGTFAAGTQENS